MQFPLVVGGVVPIINIEGVKAGELRFTGSLLADIFLGKVTKWNDPKIVTLNPGVKLPAAAIIVAHRAEASGTTFNWANYLSKVSAEWRDKVGEGLSVAWPIGVGGKGNDGVASFVKQTRNSIGYVEYAYALRSKLAYGLVQNKAGKFVPPGAKTFGAAAAGADWASAQDFYVVITDPPGDESYPIAATSFALMYKTPKVPTRTKAALDFFRWAFRDGQKLASDLGFVAASSKRGVANRRLLEGPVCRSGSIMTSHWSSNRSLRHARLLQQRHQQSGKADRHREQRDGDAEVRASAQLVLLRSLLAGQPVLDVAPRDVARGEPGHGGAAAGSRIAQLVAHIGGAGGFQGRARVSRQSHAGLHPLLITRSSLARARAWQTAAAAGVAKASPLAAAPARHRSAEATPPHVSGHALSQPQARRAVDGASRNVTGGAHTGMSDPPADARAFGATTAEPLRRELLAPNVIAAAGVGVILAIAAADAALRGPWLDEFWTLELSDSRKGLLALIRDGWMRDAHPPVFNAWATLLASLGVTSIPAGRLASNLPAAGLMILAALRLSRRTPGQAGFAASLLLLTLSLPQAMEAFAVYRSYFWQMAAIGTLTLVARHVASAKVDLDWRRDLDLGGDRRAGDRRRDRGPLCRRAVRRAFGRGHRLLRLRPGAAALGGPGAGDGGAVGPVRCRQHRAAGAELGGRIRS